MMRAFTTNLCKSSSVSIKSVEGMIEIREGRSDDEQDLPIYESLKRDIENLKELPSKPYIFKVHEGLRRTNTDAYTPLLISIGPYHHGNSKLSKMENLKLMYLKSFLQRRNESSIEQYWGELKDLKDKAASYYGDDIELEGDKFVKMLLLDGCFILEFLYSEYPFGGKIQKCDPVFMPSGMKFQVLRDLLLLENQLPFFVLKQLHDHGNNNNGNGKPTFWDIVTLTFVTMLSNIRLIPLIIVPNLRDNDAQNMKHLLQLVHFLCNPQSNNGTSSPSSISLEKQSQEQPKIESYDIRIATELQETGIIVTSSPSSSQEQPENESSYDIRTATELQEAGVHLKKVVESTSLFHIEFNRGELKIPQFHISDSTETFFRNMIAYEQHSRDSDKGSKYFTDYAQLMDNLINTEKDVNLFRMNGVLINCLGDDKEVTDLFNRLCIGVVYSSCKGFYYADVCEKLKEHYNKPWNVMKAKLKHDYFNTPWAGVSTIAAIILLLLTVAQTVIAVLALS